MRGLAGDFATMPLKDLVVYLGNRLASGTLTFESGTTAKSVVLDQGQVVNASSNLPREYLGQFLINLGHINEEQFNRAYATQRETRVFMGRILVMIGLVTEETVSAVLSLKFRETILEAIDWTEGHFTFEPGEAQTVEGLEVKVPLIEIYKESDFRQQAWHQFRKAFPRGNCTLALHRENLEEAPRPGSVDDKVLGFIESGMTLDEMALRLHATDFFLYNRLYALYRLGAIAIEDRPAPEFDIDIDLGLGDSPSVEQILENARTFHQQGKYRDAWTLARRANQITPTLDATLLLRQLEAAWLPQLRVTLVTSHKVPKLALTHGALASLSLTAQEKYLLSRIDGKRDVESIIRVAPLKELEALAFIDRFVAQKWVTLS